MEEVRIVKHKDKLKIQLIDREDQRAGPRIDMFDNFALRDSYDRVIRCLGFEFDDSLLAK